MFAQTGGDNDAEMFSDDVQHQVDGLIVESPGQTLQDVSGRVQARGQFNYCRQSSAWFFDHLLHFNIVLFHKVFLEIELQIEFQTLKKTMDINQNFMS